MASQLPIGLVWTCFNFKSARMHNIYLGLYDDTMADSPPLGICTNAELVESIDLKNGDNIEPKSSFTSSFIHAFTTGQLTALFYKNSGKTHTIN